VAARSKTEPRITEAAEKARVLIQDLQSRLRADPPAEAIVDDLEAQLQEYFSSAAGKDAVGDIRKRVIEGVVERILREWENTPLEDEVVTRLIDRVLERLS
jgi:hypothetical protein